MQNFLKKNYRWIIATVSVFFLAVSLLNAKNDSATFDEVAHIGAAYSYVAQNEIRLNPEHPPLVKNFSGLPLLFMNLNFDTTQPFWTGELPRKWDEGQWESGRHLLYKAGNDPDQIIFWSRVPIVLLSLLLGLFIFKWAKELAGTTAGLLAFFFYSFDPNILGHNHYVTTDIGIAAFMTFAFYYFLKFIKKPAWKNTLLFGIFLGLLFLAKFSAILALPIFALVIFIYPLCQKPAPASAAKHSFVSFNLRALENYFTKGFAAFAIALLLVLALYSVNTFKMSQATVARTIDAIFDPSDNNPKNILTNKTLHTLNSNYLTRPLAIYGEGIGYVFRRVAGGNGAYYFGQVSSNAFPSYFPVVFLIKETLPFLFLLFFAILYSITQLILSIKNNFGEKWKTFCDYIRKKPTQYTLLGFIVLYSYLSVTGNLNIGLRHLFPIFPFMYILVSKKLVRFLKEHPRRSQTAGIVLTCLLVWIMAETVISYPNYLSYFNQTVGGPKNGHKYVTDSNADWGQDLKRLRIWIDDYNACARQPERKILCKGIPENITRQENGIKKIRVDYFGGGDIMRDIGTDKSLLWWDSKRPIESGWYAISTNFLMGSLYDKAKKDSDSYRWLRDKTPVAQAGASILIYYIP